LFASVPADASPVRLFSTLNPKTFFAAKDRKDREGTSVSLSPLALCGYLCGDRMKAEL
jgi:hypothetical protein